MEIQSKLIVEIFQLSINNWHINQDSYPNPFPPLDLKNLLYEKNQIDTIQWHVEDEIRRPDLKDSLLVQYKRKIDALNQKRTDLVEKIEDLIINKYKNVIVEKSAKMNSETPAWLIDRMSILELKIYHMEEQTKRTDVENRHIVNCKEKLDILLDQRKDLSSCLDDLLNDLSTGRKYFKVYRQMKMYNDANLNPSLYQNQK